MAESQKKKALFLIAVAGTTAAFFYWGGPEHLTLAELKIRHHQLVGIYQQHTLLFMACFIAIYFLQTALSLPGASLLTLAAGAIFGTFTGTWVVNLGATLGAMAAMLVARYLFRTAIEQKLKRKMERLSTGLNENGLSYLLFLRLVPVFPFWLINLAAGLTRLPIRTFVIATAVGIIPGSVVYCYAGSQLAQLDSLSDVVSMEMLLAFVLLGLLALVPAGVTHWQTKRKRKEIP